MESTADIIAIAILIACVYAGVRGLWWKAARVCAGVVAGFMVAAVVTCSLVLALNSASLRKATGWRPPKGRVVELVGAVVRGVRAVRALAGEDQETVPVEHSADKVNVPREPDRHD